MKINEERELEIAKSWFELSRVLAVIAGLFLVVASLQANSYIGLKYDIEKPIKICDIILEHPEMNELNASYSECINLMTLSLQNETEKNQKFTYFLIVLGLLTIVNSLLTWIFGRIKLKNKNIADKGLFFILLILNIGIIFLIYLKLFGDHTISQLISIGNKTINLCDFGNC